MLPLGRQSFKHKARTGVFNASRTFIIFRSIPGLNVKPRERVVEHRHGHGQRASTLEEVEA